ncbi:hypothetical protein LP420_32640 [Massilia sp. B-10]|nr:hypothetical protein LP420_32640 [Massilia sp. B-10]
MPSTASTANSSTATAWGPNTRPTAAPACTRAETQTGLASSYSLNPAERSTSVVAGVDGAYMPGGTVFSEYRLRDSADTGFDAQHNAQLASGLRNSFQLRPGVSAATGIEYLKVLDGAAQEAVAVSGAIDYRVDPLWSASAKLEYRKLFDRADLLADQSQDQWLSTLTLARKLSEDWTLLARNYLLYQRNRDDLQGAALGNTVQDRAQLGFAWRPRERNDVNALARYMSTRPCAIRPAPRARITAPTSSRCMPTTTRAGPGG